MNTTGIQNYLSNVFRPFVVYDTGTSNFIPKLELSNIETYSGNNVSVFRADVGDPAFNVYVGSNAGNSPFVFGSYLGCSGVSAFGYTAGSNISNDYNSVYVGYGAGVGNIGTSNTIAIGPNAGTGGQGVSNIFLGTGTRSATGSSNIFIGNGIIDVSSISNQVRIGSGTNIPIAANITTKWVGLNGLLSPLDPNNKLDVSGDVRVQGQFGLNRSPGGRTLDVNGNFRAQDASLNALDFSNGFTRSTGGYVSIQSNVPVSLATPKPFGTLKKGAILITATSRSSNTDYASRFVFAYTPSNIVDIGSNIAAGNASITFNTSNIQITDTTTSATYDYTITYFPLP